MFYWYKEKWGMDMILYVIQFESEMCPLWPCIRNKVKLLFKHFVFSILFQEYKVD